MRTYQSLSLVLFAGMETLVAKSALDSERLAFRNLIESNEELFFDTPSFND